MNGTFGTFCCLTDSQEFASCVVQLTAVGGLFGGSSSSSFSPANSDGFGGPTRFLSALSHFCVFLFGTRKTSKTFHCSLRILQSPNFLWPPRGHTATENISLVVIQKSQVVFLMNALSSVQISILLRFASVVDNAAQLQRIRFERVESLIYPERCCLLFKQWMGGSIPKFTFDS